MCPCILDDVPLISDSPSRPICGEELCPTVEFVPRDLFCSIPEGEQVGLVNPEALTCALKALRQHMVDERTRHTQYTRAYGEDLPEVRDWKWPGAS